ncbi:matrix metalloproteinase-14-like isoform X3 [Maniola hyperantus]|uniref:matrix metalloproteinase-14-like isoform X3 n=1 Tax=Aphantopus hyperantus TaxID=2795564 RepID=UPI00374A4678
MLKETLVFLSMACIAFAAVGLAPLEEKPKRFEGVEGCYISKLDAVIPLGKAAPSKDSCMEYRCRKTHVQFATCGIVVVTPPCYTVQDFSKPYPECCPQLRCHKYQGTSENITYYEPVKTPPSTTTNTTTIIRRPNIYHHHPEQRLYTPSRYPTVYTERPSHPDRPHYPIYPDRSNDRRYYNTTEEHLRRINHHYPKPTDTTTQVTYRPRYPYVRPEYPTRPRLNYPRDPGQDYPEKNPYYPVETTTMMPTPPPDIPDTCDTSYDAVTLIRGELFIFKNTYHWRIGANGRYPGYPIEISRMWSELPQNLTHVDTVYERPDRKIAFFIGKQLYLFDSQHLLAGYPKNLVQLGLPEHLEKLDAAMVWGHNGKTYFFNDTMYWIFDEKVGRVELDYPRDMARWKGVGYNIDTVFQWKDGRTYFFKGKGFWKFNDLQMRVEHERQLPSAQFWMSCPAEHADRHIPKNL